MRQGFVEARADPAQQRASRPCARAAPVTASAARFPWQAHDEQLKTVHFHFCCAPGARALRAAFLDACPGAPCSQYNKAFSIRPYNGSGHVSSLPTY